MDLLVAALPAFLASLVEFVEALTIVLAVGVTRGWRPSLSGATAAFAALAAAVLLLGPSLTRVDEDVFTSVIGSLLLLFGLRWLHKAILRYAGVVALRDERAKYAASQAGAASLPTVPGFDWLAAAISFKATLLEGLEVVFIVLAAGARGDSSLRAASLGAALALAAVVAAGFVVRGPLSRVPENTLKFGVGVMLCSFGAFWAGEGLGVRWPGAELSLPVLLVMTLALAGGAVAALRREPVAA